MPSNLRRYQQDGHNHFLTLSGYRRFPIASVQKRMAGHKTHPKTLGQQEMYPARYPSSGSEQPGIQPDSITEVLPMKEPGLDGRHRDQDGRIQLKNGNARNGNLSQPIEGFSPLAKVGTMRKETGEKGLAHIRAAAEKRK